MPSNLNPKCDKLAATLSIGKNRYGIGPTGKLYVHTSCGWDHLPGLKANKPGVANQLQNLLKQKRANMSRKSPASRKSKSKGKSQLGLVDLEPLFIVKYGKNQIQYTQQGNGFVYRKVRTKWRHVKKQDLSDELIEALKTQYEKYKSTTPKKSPVSRKSKTKSKTKTNSKTILSEDETKEMKKAIAGLVSDAIHDALK